VFPLVLPHIDPLRRHLIYTFCSGKYGLGLPGKAEDRPVRARPGVLVQQPAPWHFRDGLGKGCQYVCVTPFGHIDDAFHQWAYFQHSTFAFLNVESLQSYRVTRTNGF
jgi:hypothetical protein